MSKHYQANEREKLVLKTWVKFSRANNTLNQIMRHNVEVQGLTISQFGVLEVLAHIGPLSVKAIGQKLLLTTSNLVTVIDNLVKQELVKRVPCDHDRRSIIIHLKEKGSGIIEPVFKNHLTELLICFSVLDDQQLITLGSLSKELGLKQQPKET
ncbi:MAG: MarR family transcriptional regulator [Candidatus Marinimicrobia bacterium]|nr:MarR family transcriptional regulator [Candidatus Neomarinimicrobiota bacterium]